MHLSLERQDEYFTLVGKEENTIVPNVMSPTSAFGGSIPIAAANAPRSAFKSSSSKHVSTTNKKIGGMAAGLANVYSIVVYLGNNSGGRFVFEISL